MSLIFDFRSVWLLAVLVGLAPPSFANPQLRMLDNFDNIDSWRARHTDDVVANLQRVDSDGGSALRMDFDFGNVNGYATAQRKLPLDLPSNYEISFRVRGDAPVNTFQFKLIDSSGENVWWINRPDMIFSQRWQRITIKKRQLGFAWGPSSDHELKRSASVEFVVSSGRDGGKGSVFFDQFTLRELPPVDTVYSKPSVTASSARKNFPAAAALDGDLRTAWRSDPARGGDQTLDIDFKRPREFGGLVLHWRQDEAPARVETLFSEDGRQWHIHGEPFVRSDDGDAYLLSESETRYLRLVLHGGATHGYGLNEIQIKDLDWGASPNAFFQNLAKVAPRGEYARGFVEQSYWTIVGVDGGPAPALMSEDGVIEPHQGGYSIEPALIVDGKSIGWADVTATQTLAEGYLPMPMVQWKSEKIKLGIDAFARGPRDATQLVARYRVSNMTDAPLRMTLKLAIRPFQVNPPAQFLNSAGGVSAITSLKLDGNAVNVNEVMQLRSLTMPDDFFVGTVSDEPSFASPPQAANHKDKARAIYDVFGYASGALVYELQLPPHAEKDVELIAAVSGALTLPDLGEADALKWVERERETVAAQWRSKLDRVTLTLPPQAQRIADAVRTAHAHILLSRDGAALRPGTRSYARSWIRDGAMIAEALLRLGDTDSVRDYVNWYAPHQFANGKVPCCVDHRGSDPVPENDSHGELIHAIAELYRYGGDRAQLQTLWPHVEAAIDYMNTLRASETGKDDIAFKGLMPASISHEGYSSKPMHSYWDDFWALIGYKDAVELAHALGKTEVEMQITKARDDFRRDLFASIARSMATHAITFIPGCAELGDFDATSATVALSPAGEQAAIPQPLRDTFEKYWHGFVDRRDGVSAWKDYTPYEWRTVSSFVRLGWRDRAQAAIDFLFASGERPHGWNQWAEVVGHDPREIRFIGDMPHAWVASDFIRSALDLFAYERDADHALVLAGGVSADWLGGDGVGIDGLHTRYGQLGFTLRQEPNNLHLHVGAGATPPGGFVFAWPRANPPGATRINGKLANWHDGELHIPAAPAEILIESPTSNSSSR